MVEHTHRKNTHTQKMLHKQSGRTMQKGVRFIHSAYIHNTLTHTHTHTHTHTDRQTDNTHTHTTQTRTKVCFCTEKQTSHWVTKQGSVQIQLEGASTAMGATKGP